MNDPLLYSHSLRITPKEVAKDISNATLIALPRPDVIVKRRSSCYGATKHDPEGCACSPFPGRVTVTYGPTGELFESGEDLKAASNMAVQIPLDPQLIGSNGAFVQVSASGFVIANPGLTLRQLTGPTDLTSVRSYWVEVVGGSRKPCLVVSMRRDSAKGFEVVVVGSGTSLFDDVADDDLRGGYWCKNHASERAEPNGSNWTASRDWWEAS